MNEMFGMVEKHATRAGLDPFLVAAIVGHESAWEPWTVRFEPGWKYFYFVSEHADKIGISKVTEQHLQMFSWGLGQIMGSVARENGFEDHLTKLTIPDVNLFYMCKILKNLYSKYGNETDVIAAYNMGSPRKTKGGLYENQKNYVDPICSVLREMRKLK
jgi:preprotein translocase subunit SecG